MLFITPGSVYFITSSISNVLSVLCLQQQLNHNLSFSLVPSENISLEPVNFIAATDEIYNIWTDAINALLGSPVSSA